MVAWHPFRIGDKCFDLGHLHPYCIQYVQAAGQNKPERRYQVQVIFGLHCFTRSPKPDERFSREWCYSDSRETRTFCLQRYELSKRLPEIINDLSRQRCYHTQKGNFFVVEILDTANEPRQYEVYFKASRPRLRGMLNLFVQSAYVRDKNVRHPSLLKSVRLFVILHNTLIGKTIKAPP